MNKKVLAAGFVVVAPLVLVLANGFRFDPRSIDSPLVRKPAPSFTLAPLGGGVPVSVAGLRGKPVVINFWATWCVPCQQEHGELLRASRTWEGRAAFLGVVYQDEPAKIDAWLDRMGRGYPQLVDTGSSVAMAFGVYGVPETYVVDGAGTIAHKYTGPVTSDIVGACLDAVTAGKDAAATLAACNGEAS